MSYATDFMAEIKAKNPGEPEFHQAVQEVVESLVPVFEKSPFYRKAKVLERIACRSGRCLFRVPWIDDQGEIQINRGYRVEMNSAIGPYKGGLRFHPTVYLGLLKFLAFEQVFKNSLTTLPMGGGKGGSDFDPHGKSDMEVMKFCQSFMTELCRHIGQFTDVPAGDIGVGGREIGYMFGQYKRVRNEFVGVLTGKGIKWGGSLIRPEATGYGCVYFAQEMLGTRGQSLRGQDLPRLGIGQRRAVHGREAPPARGQAGHPLRLRRPRLRRGGHRRREARLRARPQEQRRGRISEYAAKFKSAVYVPFDAAKGFNLLWDHKADCAFPSATQNEINLKDAENLLGNGVYLVSEGANMPTTPEGVELFVERKILYAPGKAANAGGVATSGLEMSQNSLRMAWSREEVDAHLQTIMKNIHRACVDAAAAYGMQGNYVAGANIAGFIKVADAMLDQGVV